MAAAICGVDSIAGQLGCIVSMPLHPCNKRQVEADGDEPIDFVRILARTPLCQCIGRREAIENPTAFGQFARMGPSPGQRPVAFGRCRRVAVALGQLRGFLKVGYGTRDIADLQQVEAETYQRALLILQIVGAPCKGNGVQPGNLVFVRQFARVEQAPSKGTGELCLRKIVAFDGLGQGERKFQPCLGFRQDGGFRP